ncbi:MAG: LytTR family DNA-binding domain-containing protein [Bacteroidota bacterium]
MRQPPYSCLIVDDEAMSRQALRRLIEQSPRLALMGIAEDASQARSFLKKEVAEIMFLDIEMPGMSGLELLASTEPLPKVVLVSSHAQYAVDAFEFEVTDYLVKPVTVDRFEKAIARLTSQMIKDQQAPPAHVLVKHKDRRIRLDIREILWVEALGDYMRLHTAFQRYVIHSTMKKLADDLPEEQFIRIHRSYLVQRSAIQSIGSQRLELSSGASVPIGKSYRKRVLADLLENDSD